MVMSSPETFRGLALLKQAFGRKDLPDFNPNPAEPGYTLPLQTM